MVSCFSAFFFKQARKKDKILFSVSDKVVLYFLKVFSNLRVYHYHLLCENITDFISDSFWWILDPKFNRTIVRRSMLTF